MHVARVCRAKYPDLDGKGAAIGGGRWNSPGTRMVYTSSCGALAVLEYRVHTSVNPEDLLMYTVEIPDGLKVETVNWTPDILTARKFGDIWIRDQRSPVLAVPSVVVPRQVNYLLNPQHADVSTAIRIMDEQPFMLDLRLFDSLSYP